MPVERLLMHVVKIVCQTSLLLYLTWVSLATFCLDQRLTKIVCSTQQHHLSLVRRYQNKWLELLLWGTCSERSINHMSRQGIRIFFMCSIIIISFSKVLTLHLHCDTGSPGRSPPSSFSHLLNIFAINALSRQGKSPAWAFYKLFSSD